MHRIHLRDILRDAAIAHAIQPTIDRNKLGFAETRDALTSLGVARPATIAAIVCPKSGR